MKKASIILYILYATFIVAVLTFGQELSQKAIAWFEEKMNEKNISDVVISLDGSDELLADREYQPQYTAKGRFRGDAGLVFTSLDTDYLAVSDSGALRANMDFEGDVLDAAIKVTSIYDDDFEKVFTFRFVKKYPENFKLTYSMSGYSDDAKVLYLGVPVYISSSVPSDCVYNVKEFDIVYDEEYFDMADDGGLIPKKLTSSDQKLTFTIIYSNGATAKSNTFEIAEPEDVVVEVDEIRINDTSLNEFEATSRDKFIVTFYSNGEKVDTDYTVEFSEGSDASDGAGGFSFGSSGDNVVVITAANGFTKTVHIKIRNVIDVPKLLDTELQESRYITMLDTDVKSFSYTFAKDVTYESVHYEYDGSVIQISSSPRSFTITPVGVGTTTLKLIIDDGFSRLEETYTVEIKEDERVETVITENSKTFVPKILGHCLMFAVLAFFAMNMFKYSKIRPIFVRFPVYTLTGLWVAALTEYLQTRIPNRTGRVQDVLIDMLGFFVGTLLIVVLRILFKSVFYLIKLISRGVCKASG